MSRPAAGGRRHSPPLPGEDSDGYASEGGMSCLIVAPSCDSFSSQKRTSSRLGFGAPKSPWH